MQDDCTLTIPPKVCGGCGREWPASARFFRRCSKVKSGLAGRCKVCTARPVARERVLRELLTPEGFKYCGGCGRAKPATLDHFRVSPLNPERLYHRCKECERDYEQTGARKEYRRLWQGREREADPERIRARNKRWREDHPGESTDRVRRYRDAHPDLRKAEWDKVKADPELLAKDRSRKRALQHSRRAQKLASEGQHSADDIERMYADQAGLCAYCEAELHGVFEADHMVPLCRGGSNGWENIAISCPDCNRRKHRKTATEFVS